MWFKNLQIYRLASPWTASAKTLEKQLSQHLLRPCGAFELQTQGWVSPRDDGALVYAVNGQLLIKLGTEKKLLPSSVIKETVRTKSAEIEQGQGFKLGKKQLRDLKNQVTEDLLPRAFNVRRNTWVWIDVKSNRIVLDVGSLSKSEEVIAMLIRAIPDLSLERLDTKVSSTIAMTAWLGATDAKNAVPHGFTIDQETELQSPLDEKATVRFVRHTLEHADVARHIKAGKQCTRLALTWASRVSFVLADACTIKRISPVDVVSEGDESAPQNEDERFDADTTMMTGELTALIDDLVDALGGADGV